MDSVVVPGWGTPGRVMRHDSGARRHTGAEAAMMRPPSSPDRAESTVCQTRVWPLCGGRHGETSE